jgi:nitrogenase molybdenum-iron protein alpha/beta subunit
MAIEGIADAAVLLNGPTGCKFYHGAIADHQLPRADSLDPLHYSEEFYFGQPRVPATYLDGDDYVFGAAAKIKRILPVVAAKGHRLLAVVNSPGAALIGDDLERLIAGAGLSVPCVTIETTGFSGSAPGGYETAVKAALGSLEVPERSVERRLINLAGVSIHHHWWRGDVAEIERLLGLCGVRVGAVVCAGASVERLTELRRAALNVCVRAEYGEGVVQWMRERYGMDALVPEGGAPIGFDATQVWLRAVCDRVNADPAPALRDIARAREACYGVLSRFHSLRSADRENK